MLSSSAQGRVLGTNLAALEGAAVFLGSNHKQQTKPRSSASPSSFVYLFFIFSTLSADRRGSYKQSSSCSIPLPLSLLLNSSIGRVSSAASSLSFGIQQPATIAKQRTNQWQKRPSSASSRSATAPYEIFLREATLRYLRKLLLSEVEVSESRYVRTTVEKSQSNRSSQPFALDLIVCILHGDFVIHFSHDPFSLNFM